MNLTELCHFVKFLYMRLVGGKMSEEEKKAMKEVHYSRIKQMCWNYQDQEIVFKYSFIEETISNIANLLNPYKDNRLIEINKLIDNLIKERNRIIEIDKLGDSNVKD